MTSHYGEEYWRWQRKIGKIGGILNKFKFEDHIRPTDCVLDFGCGGGYLLKELECRQKFGFEINQAAHQEAIQKNGLLHVYDDFEDIPDCSFNVIISNHALEHVPNPLEVLKQLYRILVSGGTIVIVLPCEQAGQEEFDYKSNDINQHLYSWCPQTFGNLAKLAGFNLIESKSLLHRWVPDYESTYLDDNIHERCKQYAIDNGYYQIKFVGTKQG